MRKVCYIFLIYASLQKDENWIRVLIKRRTYVCMYVRIHLYVYLCRNLPRLKNNKWWAHENSFSMISNCICKMEASRALQHKVLFEIYWWYFSDFILGFIFVESFYFFFCLFSWYFFVHVFHMISVNSDYVVQFFKDDIMTPSNTHYQRVTRLSSPSIVLTTAHCHKDLVSTRALYTYLLWMNQSLGSMPVWAVNASLETFCSPSTPPLKWLVSCVVLEVLPVFLFKGDKCLIYSN